MTPLLDGSGKFSTPCARMQCENATARLLPPAACFTGEPPPQPAPVSTSAPAATIAAAPFFV